MATISPTYTKLESERNSANMLVITWTPVTEADTCAPAACGDFADRSVQFDGTFGGATVKLQGSNNGSAYADLTDPQGNAISKTSAALEAVMELTAYTKPVISGGTSQSLTITLIGRRQP